MSFESSSFDAYRSPSLPEGPVEAAPPGTRPGWLTTLCVLAIVLGVLGIGNSILSVAGAIGGKALQSAFRTSTSSSTPNELEKAQQDFQANIQAVQDKYFWVIMPALGLRFIVAVLLVVGGIRALGLKEGGRQLLVAACAVAATLELGQGILQTIINMEMMTVVHSFEEGLINALPKQGNVEPNTMRFIQTVIRVAIVGGMVFNYLLALLKIGFYLFGLNYLRRDGIKALFQPPETPPAEFA
jgi:hypothetical protein